MVTYRNKNNPELFLDPTQQDLATRQGAGSDITFGEKLLNSGYVADSGTSSATTPKATTQKTVNAADLMAGRVDANGNPTIGQAYAGLIPGQNNDLESAYAAQGQLFKDAMNPVDENKIRADTQARFQAEIDALNRIYAEKKAQERIAGQGRLGQATAVNARRGLIGSDFGATNIAGVEDQNRQIQNAIDSELNLKLSGIYSKISQDAKAEAEAKLAARQQGAQQYVEFLKGAATRKEDRINGTIANILGNNLEPDESVFSSLASQLGTSVQDLKARYNTEKAKIVTQGKLIEVSPGASLFDQNGRLIGTAPNKPTNGEPLTKEVNGTLSQYDTNTGTWKQVYNSPIKNNLPASAQEYEYAVSQGYKGTFSDYQNEDANRKRAVEKQDSLPSSYREWQLSGSPGTYYDFINRNKPVGKPPTEAEKRAFNFFKRAEDAKNTLDGLDSYVAGLGLAGQAMLKVPNIFQSTEAQQYNQAKRYFIESYLRKDSGAVISPSEYEQADKNYFVQPGDTSETIARKKAAREKIIEGLKSESGKAYTDSYGENSLPTTPQQNNNISDNELEELRQAFPGMSDQELMQQAGFNQPLSTGVNGSLGGLSQKYESSGDPGAIGYDSTGGFSYGTYQLAHNNAQRFVAQSPYAQEFAGIPFNSVAFRNKWKEVARKDPQGFAQAQEQYIAKTHFEPLAAKAAQAGLDLAQRSPVLAEVVFSTGVQHGAGTDVINRALARVGNDASDAEIIKAIYQERWGGGRRFASSTPQVQRSVYNRFFGKNGELATALNQLRYS